MDKNRKLESYILLSAFRKKMSDSRWCLDEDIQDDAFRHIYPVEDVSEHELKGVNCWCDPTIDLENSLVIHNRIE